MEQEMQRMTDILDAKHKKADLNQIASSADHLTNSEQSSLLALLKKHEVLFDGALGAFTGTPCDIKLKENVEPHHARPFPVPKTHELTLKSESDRSCALNVLKRVNRSQWGAPTFIVPKKDGTARFISDFRELNKGTHPTTKTSYDVIVHHASMVTCKQNYSTNPPSITICLSCMPLPLL
jgi:hypothetical protein